MKGQNFLCCTALAFVNDGIRHGLSRTRLQQPRLSLASGDHEHNIHSRLGSDCNSRARRTLVEIISTSITVNVLMMNAESAYAACLSGDIRPECIGVYKLPIDAAESPYVATPEKLKIYAPDLQWVPPTPYPATYADALLQLKAQRQQLAAAQDLIARGNIEQAGLALLDITPKVSAAGIVILRSMNNRSNEERNLAMKINANATNSTGSLDGNPSSSPNAIALEMKTYRIRTALEDLLGSMGETDILVGQGLRGDLGASAPAQVLILSNLSDCIAEYDNLLGIIPDEMPK